MKQKHPYTSEQRSVMAELASTHKQPNGRIDWKGLRGNPAYSRVGLDKRSQQAVAQLAYLQAGATVSRNGVDPVARLLDLENQTKLALAELHRKKQELQEQTATINELLNRHAAIAPEAARNTTIPCLREI